MWYFTTILQPHGLYGFSFIKDNKETKKKTEENGGSHGGCIGKRWGRAKAHPVPQTLNVFQFV